MLFINFFYTEKIGGSIPPGPIITFKNFLAFIFNKMSVTLIIILILGILMLIEGCVAVFFPKFSLGISRRIVKSIEKNLKIWGIGEIIIALILIIISLINLM